MAPKEPKEEKKKEEKKEEKEPKEEEPDSPVVLALKKVDDEYLAIQVEYEKESQALAKKYDLKQAPLLEQRKKILEGDSSAEDPKTGTPAIKGFWARALQNHPAFEELVQEHDEPVLDFLKDITQEDLDPEDSDKGFKLHFHFAENPFFSNTTLSKEYIQGKVNAYNGDSSIEEIKGCTIEWKSGKNVTVEMVKKKVKGKKSSSKPAKETEEPRESFFRSFFRTIKEGDALPEDIDVENLAEQMGADDPDDIDEEQLVECLMENDHDSGCAVKDYIIPFAVRWYTGEAAPEEDEDSDDEDDEDDDDDDDDEDESEDESEDEPPAKGKKGNQGKKDGKKGGGGAGALFDDKKKTGEGEDGKKKDEECKQQ